MLHKKLKFGLLGLTCVILTGCGNSSSNAIENSIEYLPVQIREGKNWSFVDSKGNIVAEDEFKNEPSVVVNGMFSVKEGENYSLYNIKDLKHEVLNELVSVGVYNDGIIPVTEKNERITLVDNKGKVKATLEPVDGKEIIRCANAAIEGMLAITNEDGEVGYADTSGKVKIKPQYSLAFGFSEGVALVVKQGKENDEVQVSIIDKSGKQLFAINNDYSVYAYGFNKGLLLARNNEQAVYGFFNKKGEFSKVSSKVQEIGSYNSKYFAYKDSDNEWGIIDMKGETVIKAKYDAITILPDGDFFAMQKNSDSDNENYDCFILNKNGEKKLKFEGYKYVRPYNSHFEFIGQTNNKYAIIDKKGEQIGKDYFANISGIFWLQNLFNNPVTSDFFNPESVVNALTETLGMGCIGSYSIGKSVSDLGITNYEDYVDSYKINDSRLNKTGWRFSTNFFAESTLSIANRIGELDAFYNWHSHIVPNQDATIEAVSITANTEKSCWNDIKQNLIQEIEQKGYELTENHEDSIYFTGKDCSLWLVSSGSGTEIIISVSNTYTPLFNPVLNEPTYVNWSAVEIDSIVAVDEEIDW